MIRFILHTVSIVVSFCIFEFESHLITSILALSLLIDVHNISDTVTCFNVSNNLLSIIHIDLHIIFNSNCIFNFIYSKYSFNESFEYSIHSLIIICFIISQVIQRSVCFGVNILSV
eukprot:1007790_1